MQSIAIVKLEKFKEIMTSYHDLEKATYDEIRAKPFTRIHGRPSWRAKERLIKDSRGPALTCRVSYDWSGPYGLLAEIVLPQANPTAAQIRQATEENNLAK